MEKNKNIADIMMSYLHRIYPLPRRFNFSGMVCEDWVVPYSWEIKSGWEAILLKKPVFLLGNMFYSNFKYINNIDKLPNRLKNHLLLGLDDQDYEDELELYVASYLKSLQDGSYITYFRNNLMDEENFKNLYKSFVNQIKIMHDEQQSGFINT